MSTLAQWREALAEQPPNGRPQYYHAEMVSLLEAGEREVERLERLIDLAIERRGMDAQKPRCPECHGAICQAAPCDSAAPGVCHKGCVTRRRHETAPESPYGHRAPARG